MKLRTLLWSYETRLLVTLSLAEATMFIDRLTLGFLSPFVVKDLRLSNLQLGLLSSVFSLTFALSGYGVAALSDRIGQRRSFLILSTVVFSALSAACGLASGFASLLVFRLLLGIAEGPYLPIVQAVMIPVSSPARRDFNSGFLQNVAPFLLGQIAGPIVITQLATWLHWRTTFLLTAVPGLLVIPFLARLLPKSQAAAPAGARQAAASQSFNVFHVRNVRLCVALAACTGTWILLCNTFLPLYLVRVAGYEPTSMAFLMSLLGVGGCMASVALPVVSHRIGRKPVLMTGFILGLATPLAVLFAPHEWGVLAGAIAVGSCLLGCTPLTVTIVPSDSVPSHSLARAIGLVSASSAIVGGVVMPPLAGRLADGLGLQVPIWITLGAACLGIALAFGLEHVPAAQRMPAREAPARLEGVGDQRRPAQA